MKCEAKHVKFEPSEKEWKCPKCNAKCGVFHIYESVEDSDGDCNLLHPADILRCTKCNYETSGQAFSNMIKKKLNMIPCPHCKGTGYVQRGKG